MGILDFLFGGSDGIGDGKYNPKDAAEDTGDSAANVRAAWHEARTDSGVRIDKTDSTQDRNFRFNPEDKHGDSHYVRGPKAR